MCQKLYRYHFVSIGVKIERWRPLGLKRSLYGNISVHTHHMIKPNFRHSPTQSPKPLSLDLQHFLYSFALPSMPQTGFGKASWSSAFITSLQHFSDDLASYSAIVPTAPCFLVKHRHETAEEKWTSAARATKVEMLITFMTVVQCQWITEKALYSIGALARRHLVFNSFPNEADSAWKEALTLSTSVGAEQSHSLASFWRIFVGCEKVIWHVNRLLVIQKSRIFRELSSNRFAVVWASSGFLLRSIVVLPLRYPVPGLHVNC